MIVCDHSFFFNVSCSPFLTLHLVGGGGIMTFFSKRKFLQLTRDYELRPTNEICMPFTRFLLYILHLLTLGAFLAFKLVLNRAIPHPCLRGFSFYLFEIRICMIPCVLKAAVLLASWVYF